MTSITIRHVPDEVRNELAARAARAGQSLQEYMLAEVTRLSERPSIADLMAEVRAEKELHPSRVTRAQILADLEADRR
ncbi:hypothetical protein HUN08_13645 [Gordonia sp. X0973]|uniref:FitA-like ribbon-helix-helix domain-containing protein n=1 Tax=Gordonia sp. X0973 TaxID=2742602 RepID=UPI000F5310DB|nr:hypothetical protein [Gordonia sp. X0973]QKT08113.1 hypothetical protein HUN08_13645 [Gordonia sp. X0973]